MSNTADIHEGFMNDSRTILPRVGGGVGGGCGLRFIAEFSTHLPVPTSDLSDCVRNGESA